MGSLQEGPERNGELGMGDEDRIGGAQALREASEEREEWWMSEDQGILAVGSTPADISDSWKRGEEEMRKREEEWEEKERAWHEERQKLKEEYEAQLEKHLTSEEELKVETDMLKARVLELEVVNTMAKWESVGVQATSEDDEEKCIRAELEEKLVSITKENEGLKKDLEQMRISAKGDQQKCVNYEICSKESDVQAKPQQNSKHEDELRREYESQIRNIRELRSLYEERMKAAEEQSKKLREELQEKSRRLDLSRKRCSELRAHSQELEALLGEQESVARGLQTRLSASLEEGRVLASQLATVNKLFGRLGDTAELDFERLRLLQHSCDKDGDAPDCANSAQKAEGGEEVSELKDIAASLPKVWRLLVELLGEEHKEEEKTSEEAKDTSEDCFNSVPTPYGPRLVISVSRTFIKLKDLILEKKSLQSELGKIRDLNGRLESKLKQQERRLATVKVELKRTWGVVARMRAQHEQLHSSEQVLRYELQQKRKLLGELKKELEYCREKWELARLKNSQSEKEWKLLREEFRARRSTNATVKSTEANSPESGFSDGRGEDEEEDGNAVTEYFKSSDENTFEQECDNKPQLGECAAESSTSIGLDEASCGGGEASSVDVVDSCDFRDLESDKGPKSQEKVETCEVKTVCVSEEPSSDTFASEVCSPLEPLVCVEGTCCLEEAEGTNVPVVTSQAAISTPKVPPWTSSDGACSSKDGEGCSGVKDSVTGSSTPLGAERGVAPQQEEISVEERLRARAERLRRLEEQCSLLFHRVTRTTTRSAQLSSRLEELHEQYGDQQSGSRGRSRTESPATLDTETRVRPPTPALVIEHPPTPPPLPTSLPSIRLPSLLHQFTPITETSGSTLMSSDSLPAEISEGDLSEVERIPSAEESMDNRELEDALEGEEYLALSIGDSSVDLGNLLPRIQSTESSSSLASNLSEDPSEENESQEMEELGLSMEESSNGGGEATESSMTEDTVDSYMADMSSAIYGLHHGPLFDEGNLLLDEEEGGEDEAEEEEEDVNEEVSAVTAGSIGVASLLLQQLPKRMDILRRERHSLEQRLEEGEAALMRALAGTAAAERRARVLERGLEQAQERLRVLEMEAAVERNERLLEIKAALLDNREGEGNSSNESNTQNGQSKSLEEEVNNLQEQTLAQIAGLQAAAVVSRTQKEQLDKLTSEVERQEKTVGYMERELATLRQERGGLLETLEETKGHLKDATSDLDQKEEENKNLKAEIEKLKKESDESNRENLALFSRLAAAESEVTRLNAEVEQLKDDSDHLREAVIRLTGEKEALYRTNHNLEEMKRLVLEDSRWVADKESEKCTACGVSFSLIIRRHHCRNCGRIFCGACSSHWLALQSAPQSSSLVAGVVDTIMSVAGAGKRYRACADCFAAHCADADGDLPGPSHSSNQKTDDRSPDNEAGSSEGAGELGDTVDGEDDDEEDFSMISEEEVSFSQCTPYVPNPRTLQYWKSCEIQCGVTLSAKDLLAATVPDSNEPGNGKGEVIWVRAGSIYSVPLLIDDTHVSIFWEFSTDPNSIAFSVLYKTAADIPMSCALIVVPTRRVDSHLKPVRGRLRPKNSGVYVLMFDNSFSRFTGKKITYSLKAEISSGRESAASSCRSSAEPFPDLPIHQEGDVTEGDDDGVAEDHAREEAEK